MRYNYTTFIGLVFVLAGTLPVLADAACESEFLALMQQRNAGFPYEAIIKTEFAGRITEVPVIVVSAEHSMTFNDDLGQRNIHKDNKWWMSTNKGKSWKLAVTLPKDTAKKTAARLARQASRATDITCADGKELDGKTYRLVQGKFTTDGTNLPALQKFYVTGPGETWQVAVT